MNLVIMAGGMGTRFWPASREHAPKQYLAILGGRRMIEETYRRVEPLAPAMTLAVVNDAHLDLTREVFGQLAAGAGGSFEILGEPRGRNTAPCIGLAAVHLRRAGRDEPMVVLPADHFIADAEGFRRVLRAAVAAADEEIVTIGITPTHPETGYGYIRRGPEVAAGELPVYAVEAFVEKPDLATAGEYLESGSYLWNAGIFVVRPQVVLEQIRIQIPQLFAGLSRVEAAIGTPEYPAVLRQVYDEISAISFDYGIMEHTDLPVRVIPGNFGWSDVGNWRAAYELRKHEGDSDGNLARGEVVLAGCRNTFVDAVPGRLVAVVGTENLVVVDTPDALLVADLNQVQRVKEVVDELRRRGKDELL